MMPVAHHYRARVHARATGAKAKLPTAARTTFCATHSRKFDYRQYCLQGGFDPSKINSYKPKKAPYLASPEVDTVIAWLNST